jgi:hypothetical protein
MALAPGDVIMPGMRSGVATTVAGDKLECEIEGVGDDRPAHEVSRSVVRRSTFTRWTPERAAVTDG